VNCGDETRIAQLIDGLPPEGKGQNIYICTKLALVRYVRRVAPAWAVAGVNLNALAPGAVETTIMDSIPHYAEMLTNGTVPFQTIPIRPIRQASEAERL
jgi:NAD(P)-dependent dehydrogenase (short-subunit alcohol dehydrogenase family)